MIPDEILCRAAAEADMALLESLPDVKANDYVFSIGFERKMKRILRREAHPTRYRLLKMAACLILTVFLSGSVVLLVSAEARAAVFGWVRDIYESYFVYSYTGSETELPDGVVYHPGWLPDEYHAIVMSEPDGQVINVYENNEGAFIVFTYSFNIESSAVYVLVWTDEDRGAIFSISGHLTQDEFIRMAENIQAVQAGKQNHPFNQGS